MSASTSPPRPSSATPAAAPPAAPLEGAIFDRGIVSRDTVRARTWELHGTGKVLGAATVVDLTAQGTLVVGGALAADRASARGTLEVGGPIEIRSSLSVGGRLRAAGAVHAAESELVGSTTIAGELRVDRALRVRGSLSAPALWAGQVSLRGNARVPGTISAHDVSMDLEGDSALGAIEAGSVRLVARAPHPVARLLGHRISVSVERVEAETAELTAVDVRFVRAKRITLGRDSHVGALEGTVVRSHPSSRIGPESRSPPPPGLSR